MEEINEVSLQSPPASHGALRLDHFPHQSEHKSQDAQVRAASMACDWSHNQLGISACLPPLSAPKWKGIHGKNGTLQILQWEAELGRNHCLEQSRGGVS